MNAHNQTSVTPTYEDLLDIIEAPNFLIAELQAENTKLRKEKEKLLSVPPIMTIREVWKNKQNKSYYYDKFCIDFF